MSLRDVQISYIINEFFYLKKMVTERRVLIYVFKYVGEVFCSF